MLRTILIWIEIALAGMGNLQAAGQEPSSSTPAPSASHRTLVNRYCVTCHNEKLRTADLVLNTLDIEKVSEDAAVWETAELLVQLGATPFTGTVRSRSGK